MFHRVRPALSGAFQPNRGLEITPAFLDEVLTGLNASDVDIVSMDEAHRRLVAGDNCRRFVALTFDDGYRDNRTYALPILKRHNAPFTLYVVADYAAGQGRMWWVTLENVVARSKHLEIVIDGEPRAFTCVTPEQKAVTFVTLYDHLRTRPTYAEFRSIMAHLADAGGIDAEEECRTQTMGWGEIQALAEEPLVTIGAHTISHPILTQLTEDAARQEIAGSAAAIAERLGRYPEHFAYPVGQPYAAGPREFRLAREAGFKTAVTTRPGVLFADHASHLTALPRIAVNGQFQSLHYLDVLLSGAPTALRNRFRRVDAA
jgi:peptidoglycan/xylan/chitin deacetylase (PgdA/CDA1 family)